MPEIEDDFEDLEDDLDKAEPRERRIETRGRKRKNPPRYALKQIPTQTETGIVDDEGKVMFNIDILLEILNKLDKIERAVA